MQGLVKRLLFGGIAGKVLGVLRELVAAWCFGTGLVANAYRLAQAAFLLPLHGFVSDVVSGAFTPQYARLRVQDPDAAQRLFAAVQRVLLAAAVLVAIGLVLWGQHLVAVMAPGFSPEAQALSTDFVRVLAPALPAYVLVGLYGGTELVHGESRVLSARASIQSAGLLLGTLAAWASGYPILIAAGFVAAYLILLVWALKINKEFGLRITASVGSWLQWKAALIPIAKVFLILMWVPLSLLVSQIVERRVASSIDLNAVAALDYAKFITETLLIVIAMPFGMAGQAAMPTMKEEDFRKQAVSSLRALLVVGLPLSAFLWSGAIWVVEIAFKRGAFNQDSVMVTASILSAQALGIALLLVGYVAQKYLNARGRNASVLWVAVLGVVVSVAINLGLSKHMGASVLGLSTAVAGACTALVACRLLGVAGELARTSAPFVLTGVLHVGLVLAIRSTSGRSALAELSAGLVVWLALFALNSSARTIVLSGFSLLRRRSQ